jgi:hypothetical protein
MPFADPERYKAYRRAYMRRYRREHPPHTAEDCVFEVVSVLDAPTQRAIADFAREVRLDEDEALRVLLTRWGELWANPRYRAWLMPERRTRRVVVRPGSGQA